jgi:serine/threonine-protein kinase RsbW
MAGLSKDGVRVAEVTGQELVLVLDNTLEAIEGGRLRILRHLEPLALSMRTINRFEVVFEELVSNIIRHGFGADAGRSILVAVTAGPEAVHLTIEDDGPSFNPFEIDYAPSFSSLKDAKIGGLGLPVVRRFTASAVYEADAPSAAWSHLVKPGAKPANRVRVAIGR